MRTAKPLFISIAIHAALIASAVGLMSIVYTHYNADEKIVVKLLTLPPSPSSEIIHTQPPEPIKHIVSTPIKKAVRPVVEHPRRTTETIAEKPLAQPSPTTIIHSVPETVSSFAPSSGENADVIQPQRFTPPSVQKAEVTYEENHLGEIRALLAQRLKYPKNARRLNQQGDVSVSFSLSQNGEVNQITITKSSGFELLDNAAASLISSCAPEFPKPSKTIRITVPIGYSLR